MIEGPTVEPHAFVRLERRRRSVCALCYVPKRLHPTRLQSFPRAPGDRRSWWGMNRRQQWTPEALADAIIQDGWVREGSWARPDEAAGTDKKAEP